MFDREPVAVFAGRKKSEIRMAFRDGQPVDGAVVGFADPDADHVQRAVRGLLEVGAIHAVRRDGNITTAVVGPEPEPEPEPQPHAPETEDVPGEALPPLPESAYPDDAQPLPEPQVATDNTPHDDELAAHLNSLTITELREHAKLRSINLAGARTKTAIIDAITRGYDD